MSGGGSVDPGYASAPALRPRYNRNGWPLGFCVKCGKVKYIEPHGDSWRCGCTKGLGMRVEHRGVPAEYLNGNIYQGPARIPEWQRNGTD